MRTFQYSTRDYVPSVDLNTLGKTFDTLEQGHKEAVKAASDLEVVVANLEMNEAEDDFKQQLVNEIKTTIDENTIYGNSYGALDDLIMKRGNITTDGRVIGRLRSQAAKKEYDAKVDKMSIPEGMKQMYKEENPYYYEDGAIDERTGRILPGEKWTPNTNPVDTVPASTIQSYALQIAAKEAGGGEMVSFLDANGNSTSDPTQSEDGSMYRKVGNKFERLTKDKIANAYKVAIASIPGAEDSLRQDYKYANYERTKLAEKNAKTGGNSAPYIQGLTDKDGNVYTYDQWLNNKINNFTDVAAYSYNYSTIDYGTALQNRYQRQQKANTNVTTKSGVNIRGVGNEGFGTFIAGTKEVEGDAFAGAESAKIAANNQAMSLIKSIAGDAFNTSNDLTDVLKDLTNKKLADGPNTAAQYLISTYGSKMSTEDKIKLTNSFIGYYKANEQINDMLTKAGADADALRFSSDVAKGTFTNNNKYSEKIINWLNEYYANNNNAKFKVGSEILQGIATKYKTDITGLKSMGFDITQDEDGNYDVKIDANHRNLLPKFVSTIRTVNDIIPGSIGGWLTNKFTTGVDKSNYYEYGTAARMGDAPISGKPFSKLSELYNIGNEAAVKTESKVGVSKGLITFNGADDGSFAALWYRENAASLGLKDTELKNKIDMANVRVDNMFANGNFDSGKIEILDESGKTTTNLGLNQQAKLIIQKMYRNNEWKSKIKRSVMIPIGGGTGQPKGYIVGFTVPKGAETKNFKEGQTITFVVSGTTEEEINYDPSYNPSILANNIIQTSKATGSIINNMGYSTDFGDTRIIPTKEGKYSTNIMGSNKVLNESEAENIVGNIITLEQLKSQYLSGIYSDTPEHLEQLSNSLSVIANNIASITGQKYEDVELIIGNYFQNAE